MIQTPQASVAIWNYKERFGDDKTSLNTAKTNATSDVIYINHSIISIATAKSKSTPVGSFNIVLAPKSNWISRIVSGSWITIGIANADPEKPAALKMIGRINSVRVSVSTNQQTGALSQIYTIEGEDWGGFFNTNVYMDPTMFGHNEKAHISVFYNFLKIIEGKDGGVSYKTIDEAMHLVLSSISTEAHAMNEIGASIGILGKTSYDILMPSGLVKYLGLINRKGKKLNRKTVGGNIQLVSGKLVKEGIYQPTNHSWTFINPFLFTGHHTLWELLLAHSSQVINETYCDLMFIDNKPLFAFYNRVRPFVLNVDEASAGVWTAINQTAAYTPEDIQKSAHNNEDSVVSPFYLITKADIPLENVISFEAGTNWRDKYNFIEIQQGFLGKEQNSTNKDFSMFQYVKSYTQKYDEGAFSREGFRPFIIESRQIPCGQNDGGEVHINYASMAGWKGVLEEWYYNGHKTLNGSIIFLGIDKHIAVGMNIKVSSKVLGPTSNTQKGQKEDTFLLLHVENVSHNFTVSQDGQRNWITNIQFVRGIFVDKRTRPIGHKGLLDEVVLDASDKKFTNDNVIASQLI
jgi:hypothetical protein